MSFHMDARADWGYERVPAIYEVDFTAPRLCRPSRLAGRALYFGGLGPVRLARVLIVRRQREVQGTGGSFYLERRFQEFGRLARPARAIQAVSHSEDRPIFCFGSHFPLGEQLDNLGEIFLLKVVVCQRARARS